jgi:hypothetical protein
MGFFTSSFSAGVIDGSPMVSNARRKSQFRLPFRAIAKRMPLLNRDASSDAMKFFGGGT